MAKQFLTTYTFTPGAANAGTVVVPGAYSLEQFLLVTNVTTGATIYQFNKPTKGGTVSTAGGNTTLTLEADTSAMSASHRLQVFVDDATSLSSINGKLPALDTGYVPVLVKNGQLEITNDTGNPLPVGPAAQLNITGSGAALNAILFSVACDAYRSINLQITGTWVGTIAFQVSNDNTNWNSLGLTSSANNTSNVPTVTANGFFYGMLAGFQYVRAVFTAYTSGTASVVGYLAKEIVGLPSYAGTSVTVSNLTASATSSSTVLYTLNSAATTNAANIKASGANVYGLSVMNASAATKYVRLFNLTTAPTVGTSVPIMVVAVPATSSKEIEFVPALRFGTGLSVAITGGAAATDATAVAAGDVQLLVSYA